eukprot:1157224-Pelagomonas_calceolata.AAC.24
MGACCKALNETCCPAGAFRVLADKYVSDDSGTGVVHQVRFGIVATIGTVVGIVVIGIDSRLIDSRLALCTRSSVGIAMALCCSIVHK